MSTNAATTSPRRRALKFAAGLSVALGVVAAFIGAIGGLSMGGVMFTGERDHDLWSAAFLGLPCLQVAAFVMATSKDATSPRIAAWFYCFVIVGLAVVLALPAIA